MVLKKLFRRVRRKNAGRGKRKPFVKKGAVRTVKTMAGLARDVMYLKSVLNPEKKKFQFSVTDQPIGQCDINQQGYYIADVTPAMVQGVTGSTRNGNSIRVSSSYIKYQFQAQSSTIGAPIRFRIMLIKVIGPAQAASSVPPAMFSPNSFIQLGGVNAGIIDYNSDRREDTFKQYIIIRSKTVKLQSNQHNGQSTLVTGSMGIKFKSHHIKFTSDANANISDGQLIMLIVADNGNRSTVSASTLTGTNNFQLSTGANLQLDINYWYYDN